MTIEQKITIKGKLANRGCETKFMVDADAKKLCRFWGMFCGRPINQFAKS